MSRTDSVCDAVSDAGDWPEVRVQAAEFASADDIERLEDWLIDAGALSVTLLDSDDASASSGQAVLEPAPGETRLWRRVTLVALFAQGSRAVDIDEALLAAGGEHAPGALPDWQHSQLIDTHWERAWMVDYRPMRFGRRLVVAPHDDATPGVDDVVLRLDPGLAFGTGTHPTTALCLAWIDEHAARIDGASVIDYGAGSGVLAIAALLFGARAAIAVDIDPQAHLASVANARANDVLDRLRVGPASLLDEAATAGAPVCAVVDVLLANILHAPLMELAERFAALLKPGGALVMAGLLDSQSESLRLRYTPWFDFEPDVTLDGWTRLSARRR